MASTEDPSVTLEGNRYQSEHTKTVVMCMVAMETEANHNFFITTVKIYVQVQSDFLTLRANKLKHK